MLLARGGRRPESGFTSLGAHLTRILLLALLLPTALIAWIAYDQMVDTIRTDRIRTVGYVAEARHEQLTRVLRRANGRAEAFLGDVRGHCGQLAAHRGCWQQAVKVFIHSEGALGATLGDREDGHLAVGDSALPHDAIPSLPPGQLARFTERAPGTERQYVIVIVAPDTGLRMAVTYPVRMIQSVFATHPALGSSGENFLADDEGFFITNARYPSVQGHSHPISAAPMRRCLTPENAATLDLDYRDVPIIHGFRFVPEIGGGCIMAHIDQAEAFAPIENLKRRVLLAMLAFSLLAVVAARTIAGRIAEPIKQLTGVARRIAAGNLAVRATPAGYGEVAELTSAFNALTDQLAQTNAGLEQRVLERTESLHATAHRLNEAERIAHVGSWSLDHGSGKLDWSDEVFRIFEIDPHRFGATYEAFLDAIHPDDREAVRRTYEQSLAMHAPYEITHRLRMSDGRIKWVHEKCAFDFDAAGKPLRSWGMVQDITARKRAEIELRIAAAAFESGEGMLVTDADSVILRVNRAFTEITGYAADEVVGKTPRLFKSSRHDADFYRRMWETIDRTGGWQGEIWDRRKNGDEYPKWLTITAVKDADCVVTHYVGTQHDITERKLAEEKIKALAFFDPLTGLPNRTLLLDRLQQAMTASTRSGSFGALLFIDLDKFKLLNDTLGHDMGDLLLKQVAERLSTCVRGADTVARLGGDEFVVLLSGLSMGAADASAQAESVGGKILAALNRPYPLRDVAYRNTPSIGATLFRGEQTTIDALLKQADLAMYQAKAAGRNAIRFFNAEDHGV